MDEYGISAYLNILVFHTFEYTVINLKIERFRVLFYNDIGLSRDFT